MASEGYQHILNVDWAPSCIKRLQEQDKHAANHYSVADCRCMPQLADSSFDAAIDKGTIDGTLCAADGAVNAHKMLCEIHRVLRPGGPLVLISYGHPQARLPRVNAADLAWNILTYVATHKQEEETDECGQAQLTNVVEYEGPYTAKDDLDSFAMQDDVLYVYVCCKREPT